MRRASKSEGNDGFVSRYCRQAAAAATERGMREVSKDDPSVARVEDGGTITTTEIEFSHQSSRCEESACTHASIRPASRISRVSTGCASGEREGEGEKRAAASDRDRVREKEEENERGKEGAHGSVLPAPFVSTTRRYIRMGARRLRRKAKPATAALRNTCGIGVVLPATRDKTWKRL